MLALPLMLLAVLASAASKNYQTTLTQGRLPEVKPTLVKHHVILDGACSHTMDMSKECHKLGVDGICLLTATVTDKVASPGLAFSSKKDRRRRHPDTITVKRQWPCRGIAKLEVKYACDIVYPRDEDNASRSGLGIFGIGSLLNINTGNQY